MDDLKLIKRHYGENMMHLCRELFPTILEKEGLLFDIFSRKFAYTKYLYDDIMHWDLTEEFKTLIYNEANMKREERKRNIDIETPQELLKKAGYTLYECKTEKDIQSFKKYYERDEELCTFRGGRLDRCYVFFAVKDNVDEIRRKDFKHPERQDEYGTSVISIQFYKGSSNILSIKNRYNHTVEQCDATFSNNLDNIISGLTDAFEVHYKLDTSYDPDELDLGDYDYIETKSGKWYKYNYEIDGVHYCPNNIIVNKNYEPTQYDTSRYLIFDKYILDMQEKKITSLNDNFSHEDSFICDLNPIEKLEIINDKDKKTKRIIINNNIEIELNQLNRMIKYRNPNIKEVPNDFLRDCKYIETLELPNLEKMGDRFLLNNKSLTNIHIPLVTEIGNECFKHNIYLSSIDLPLVTKIGDDFLNDNTSLDSFHIPNLEEIGSGFLYDGGNITEMNLPKLKKVGDTFLYGNHKLEKLDLPSLEVAGSSFISHGGKIEEVNLPKLEKIGAFFLTNADRVTKISLPKVTSIRHGFMETASSVEEVDLPKVKFISSDFLWRCPKVSKVNLPEVEELGIDFLSTTATLKSLKLPKVKIIDAGFLHHNKVLEELETPELVEVGPCFLKENQELETLKLPNLKKTSYGFLDCNEKLKEVEIPKISKPSYKILPKRIKKLIKPNPYGIKYEITEFGKFLLSSPQKLKLIRKKEEKEKPKSL